MARATGETSEQSRPGLDQRSDANAPAAATKPDRFEAALAWAIAAALTVASVAFVIRFGHKIWFYSDMWEFVAESEIGSLDDLFGSRGANWATPTVVLIRVIYGLFEMDFWPWYFLPRLVGYSILCLWLWRVMLRRDADPVIAMAALAVLLFFAPSGFLAGAFMGHAVSIALLMASALLINATASPGRRERWVLFGFLVLTLMSNAPGVAAFGGVTVVLVVTRLIRHWWQPVLAAGAIYGAWFALFRSNRTANTFALGFDEISRIPRLVLSVLEGALPRTLEVADEYGVALVVALLATLFVLGSKGRLDRFDAIVLTALSVYILLVVVGRVLTGRGQPDSARYAYLISLMLIPVLVPKIRVAGRSTGYAVVLVVALALGVGHARQLERGLRFWEALSQDTRVTVEAVAGLVAAGEPSLERNRYHPKAGPLTTSGIERLLADGWEPQPSSDPEVVEAARGLLRMRTTAGARPSGTPLNVSETLDGNCFVIRPGVTLRGEVTEAGAITLAGPPGEVTATWEDPFGVGAQTITVNPRASRLWLAEPEPTAQLEITAGGTRVEACGLTGGRQ